MRPRRAPGGEARYLFDPDLQLYYVRNRWYDPLIKRWLTQDRLVFEGGDYNLYRYVGNSPATRDDPSGNDDGNQHYWVITTGGHPEAYYYIGGYAYKLAKYHVTTQEELAHIFENQSGEHFPVEWNYYHKLAKQLEAGKDDVHVYAPAVRPATPDLAATTRIEKLIEQKRREAASVVAPGFWEGIIPLWGSGRAFIHDMQVGNYKTAAADFAFFALDATIVGGIVDAAGKALAKTALKAGEEEALKSSTGRGLIGVVRATGKVDAKLKEYYLKIVDSPAFARQLERYNAIAPKFGAKQAASVAEIRAALNSDTTFAKTTNVLAGLFKEGEHVGPTRFWLQGSPATWYGPRAARHELLHLGAVLSGETDRFMHEIAVQIVSTPEVLATEASLLLGSVAALGYAAKEAYQIYKIYRDR